MMSRLIILSLLSQFASSATRNIFAQQWAVFVESGEAGAESLARETGFANLGLILDSYYLFEAPVLLDEASSEFYHPDSLVKREWNGIPASRLLPRSMHEVQATFGGLENIPQKPRERKTRSVSTHSQEGAAFFSDPLYRNQWHLFNNGDNGNIAGNDINVLPVWKMGINGSGITVAVVDDGVDFNHPDLIDSWVLLLNLLLIDSVQGIQL